MLVRVALVFSLLLNFALGVLLYLDSQSDLKANKQAKIEAVKKNRQSPDTSKQVKLDFSGATEVEITYSYSEIKKSLKNLPQVLRQAKAVPYIAPNSNGEVSGFKIVHVEPNSLYTRMGIESGDIILGVNGNAINSPKKAMEIYQSLGSGRLLNIQILRNGQRRVINYIAE